MVRGITGSLMGLPVALIISKWLLPKGKFKQHALGVPSMSVASAEENLTEDERRGLELVRESGGVYQSDFWKELDLSSRKGSRIVESLLEKELINRENAVYDGHNTYLLTPTARDLDFSLLMAGDMLSPFIGEEEIDAESDAFSQWLMNLAYQG